MLEELDYEYEAQNQRSFARAYRDHPFIYVPDVVTRLSRDRVLVTEYVEGMGFEQVKQLDHEARSRFARDRVPLLPRARSTSSSTSTPTRIRATTCCSTTARSRSSTSA